ncbi:YitT family protein [Kroppenstedtia pulmonis]|uniref:YitT family protein n=1 Tax=Kroppenstedtia pulmonis TaxID=1380685 RepID=A0A7D3Y1Y6_9BACL|nr:YitT family protein [Kroppenstedtia pulmonis]QKG84543.1 YitT family protein [Kroppenstedtia pulmonis]
MKRTLEYLTLTIGCLFVAASMELILAPNGMVDGGTTALSIMINHVGGIPIWLILMIFNLPILIFTARYTGKKFFIRTLYANIVTSIALALLKPVPAITSSEVLIVLYGGLLMGLGVGLVVKFGGAVDGTEMLAVWLNKRFHIRVSTFLMAVNAVIFTIAAIIFTLEKAMLSLAVFYIIAKMIDFVLDGLNQARSVMIITDSPELLGEILIKRLNVSITYIYGEGGYSGDHKKIIYCIVDRLEFTKLKELVLETDPRAILEASPVAETAGVEYKTFFHTIMKKSS